MLLLYAEVGGATGASDERERVKSGEERRAMSSAQRSGTTSKLLTPGREGGGEGKAKTRRGYNTGF